MKGLKIFLYKDGFRCRKGLYSAKGRHIMSIQRRLFLGCLVALTSTSAACAQFRMQRTSVPFRLSQPVNRAMNPMMMSARNPMMVMSPNLLGLARQQNLSRFMNPYATGNTNPYMMSNPYMAASGGYGGGSGGGYGGSSGMGSSSGNSSGNGYGQASPSAATNVDQMAAYAAMQLGSQLTALGISNKNGQLDWPLAFRLIPPGEDQDTMMQTESVVQVAVMQAAAGKAAPTVLQEATSDVLKMRHWLREHEVGMAEGTYRAGHSFLRRIEGALKIMGSY
jgi:hypothetical protein